MIHKVNDYFMNDREVELFEKKCEFVNHRIKLMDSVLDEIRGNGDWMRVCGGKVWKWFYVDLWRRILIDNRLSDEGKTKVMRMCVLEKVKNGSMSYKRMKRCKEEKVMEVKGGKKKEREGVGEEGEITEKVVGTGADATKVAA